MARAIHLTPRGLVTEDEQLAIEINKFLQAVGVQTRLEKDGTWYRITVYELSGGDLLRFVKEFAKMHDDIEVWLFMSKVYPTQID